MKDHAEVEKVINILAKHFYNGFHKFNLSPREVESLTLFTQEKLLSLTLNNDLVKMYPVSSNFCRLYLKNLLNCLEPSQDVHEGIYDYLCSIMSDKQGINDFCYRHYVIGGNFSQIVTLKETNNMVVNGTTGMKTWEAARILTDWILQNKEFFKNKNILELGSGVGFTGITLTKLCEISSVTLTDCHEDVLNVINENIKINFPKSSERAYPDEITEYDVGGKIMSKYNSVNCNAGNKPAIPQAMSVYDKQCHLTTGVKMLDWNDIDKIDLQESADIVIGADIVYDPCILEPLCKVLRSFFLKNKCLYALVACVIRNEDTFNKFIQTLGEYSMEQEKLYMPENINLEWDTKVNQCIVKIKFKEYFVFVANQDLCLD